MITPKEYNRRKEIQNGYCYWEVYEGYITEEFYDEWT